MSIFLALEKQMNDIRNYLLLFQVQRSRNKQLRDLFGDGFSIHHAGMLRQDRSLVERLFSEGLIKVLVCTATLAWGINLPAHAVIIKVYNSQSNRLDLVT